jgi:hypothetical protein
MAGLISERRKGTIMSTASEDEYTAALTKWKDSICKIGLSLGRELKLWARERRQENKTNIATLHTELCAALDKEPNPAAYMGDVKDESPL